MRRFIILLGIFLIVISMVLLFIVIEEDSPLTLQLVTALHCGEGEKATQELGSYIPRSGTSSGGRPVWFYCINAEGIERDITAQGFFTMAGVFVIPFLTGLLMLIGGVTAAARAGTKQFLQATQIQGATVTFRDPETLVTSQANLTPEQQVRMEQAFNMLDKMMPGLKENLNVTTVQSTGSGDLTTRLKQLEDARQQGLITQSEYDRLRQQILDDLV